jgi:hypothetical protein
VNYELQMVAACLRRSAAGRQAFSLRNIFFSSHYRNLRELRLPKNS